jgi:hypothetical protein
MSNACECGHVKEWHGIYGCMVRIGDHYCQCRINHGREDHDPYAAQFPEFNYIQIRLRRDGIYTVVSILHDGREIDVIREIFDNNFDHVITPDGIRDAIRLGKGEK